MTRYIGWVNYFVPGYFDPDTSEAQKDHSGAGFAIFGTTSPEFGVVGYTGEVVEFFTEWVPLTPAPEDDASWTVGETQPGRATATQDDASAFTVYPGSGTLIITAEIDGEPAGNYLRFVRTELSVPSDPGPFYANTVYDSVDSVPVVEPGLWTKRVRATES